MICAHQAHKMATPNGDETQAVIIVPLPAGMKLT